MSNQPNQGPVSGPGCLNSVTNSANFTSTSMCYDPNSAALDPFANGSGSAYLFPCSQAQALGFQTPIVQSTGLYGAGSVSAMQNFPTTVTQQDMTNNPNNYSTLSCDPNGGQCTWAWGHNNPNDGKFIVDKTGTFTPAPYACSNSNYVAQAASSACSFVDGQNAISGIQCSATCLPNATLTNTINSMNCPGINPTGGATGAAGASCASGTCMGSAMQQQQWRK